MSTPEPLKTLGEIAFKRHQAYRGDSLRWDQIHSDVKAAWEAGAQSVAAEAVRRYAKLPEDQSLNIAYQKSLSKNLANEETIIRQSVQIAELKEALTKCRLALGQLAQSPVHYYLELADKALAKVEEGK